jgi:DNA-binding NtrC family response regulator
MAVKPFVVLADADLDHTEELRRLLAAEGCETQITMSVAETLAALRRRPPTALFLGQSLPDGQGIDLLDDDEVRAARCVCILLVDEAPVADVVEAIKRGALDVLEKPVFASQVARIVTHVAGTRRAESAATAASAAPDDLARPPIVGHSPAITQVMDALKLVTKAPKATVLIEGESGTGKELIARAVHFDSPRKDGPFMAVNCAALNENLLEAELFGHEKGAFTGALASGKKGLFEAAAGGTLFLDEIGELAPGMQAKLLRVIQEGTFKRVGGIADVRADVRIIAATNRDLRREVKEGRFRADLYYRLNVVPVRVPALRERLDDVAELSRFFIAKISAELGKKIKGVAPRALERLMAYDWPGNIRELRNVCEYAAIVCDGDLIETRHLTIPESELRPTDRFTPADEDDTVTPEPQTSDGGRDLSLRSMESELIRTVLNETRFNISRAASVLGINRSTLYNKMRDLGMHPPARPKLRQSV